MLLIDAHTHLWLHQDTVVDGYPIRTTTRGRSLFFGEEVQMLPPFMIDGKNTAEVFLANMDYAQVSAAVVVQEFIDGNQNEYLAEVQKQYPNRFFCCGMVDCREDDFLQHLPAVIAQFKGLAIPGHRLKRDLTSDEMMQLFHALEDHNMILSMCLADDARQIAQMREVIHECPKLRVAIGHFGMPTTEHWEQQILLAREGDEVMVESGGITWLYNSEFYPYPSAVNSIKRAADMVGMDRLMWGSDYPRTITAITYRMSYDFITRTPLLTDDEKAMFLGQNAMRFYGFADPVELPYIKNMSE